MFCTTNEILLNITEKTKLLAQKCAQAQFRCQACKNTASNDQNIASDNDKTINGHDSKQSRCWLGTNHANPTCFCSIAGSLRIKLRKTLLDPEGGTTRWYVKVSIKVQSIE